MANENGYNKVQINRTVKIGLNPYNGKKVSETDIMINIRTEDVDEAVELYDKLIKKMKESKEIANEGA